MALGTAQRRAGDGAAAARSYLRAQELDPASIEGFAAAVSALSEAAELPAAIDVLDRAIAARRATRRCILPRREPLEPRAARRGARLVPRRAAARSRDVQGHSALLLEMQYDTEPARAMRWRARTGNGPTPRSRRAQAPSASHEAPTRGCASATCHRASAAARSRICFLPVLEAHDRARFHVTLYSAYAHDDDVTARMRRAADAWRDLPRRRRPAAALIAATASIFSSISPAIRRGIASP